MSGLFVASSTAQSDAIASNKVMIMRLVLLVDIPVLTRYWFVSPG